MSVSSTTQQAPISWDEFERIAWEPPEDLNAAQWAEKYRVLTRRQTSRPGPWLNANTPWLIGYMILCDRPGVEILSVKKCSQGGWSEATRNVIGRWADIEPDPVLVVLPDKETGKGIIAMRYRPMFEDTERLARLSTGRRWDSKNNEISLLNGFTLRLGFSGSISSVAAHPARRILCDERSKFQLDPKISIEDSIAARTSTYDRSLIINLSTPGAEPDPISDCFDAADVKLYYFVACPHCGTQQRLSWQKLHWEPKKKDVLDKNVRAAAVEANRSAWMECENPRCAAEFPEGRGRFDDTHKRKLINDGFWATADLRWKLFNDGSEEGEPPRGTRWGMHAPAFICLTPKHAWFRIAATFIRAEGDPLKLKGVYNELFAETWHETAEVEVKAGVFERKCRADEITGFTPGQAKRVPVWASRLLMTVDTQIDHFYFVIRAYGPQFRSRRIHHGKALSFAELDDWFYRTQFPYENDAYHPIGCHLLGIDSGGGIVRTDERGVDRSRTDAVYRYCLRDQARLLPLKGEGRRPSETPHRLRRVTYQPPGNQAKDPYVVFLHLIDANHYEDVLAGWITQTTPVVDESTGEVIPDDTQDLWELNDDTDPEYIAHLSANHKVPVRTGGKVVSRWVPKVTGNRHDYRDAEVYQVYLANGPGRCFSLLSPKQIVETSRAAGPAVTGGIRMPDGRDYLANWRRT